MSNFSNNFGLKIGIYAYVCAAAAGDENSLNAFPTISGGKYAIELINPRYESNR